MYKSAILKHTLLSILYILDDLFAYLSLIFLFSVMFNLQATSPPFANLKMLNIKVKN